MKHALVFGARGMIGGSVAEAFARTGFSVTAASSKPVGGQFLTITERTEFSDEVITSLPLLDAVVWAHGINLNDDCQTVIPSQLRHLLDVNVVYIANTLSALLQGGKLANGSRLVAISSLWQTESRRGKFSYTISKAAVGGLVRAASADLAYRDILVNAILPGVLDGPMTRASLSDDQLKSVVSATDFGRLAEASDIVGLTLYLCSDANRSVTGQSIHVDLGFSHVKRL
jgi:NAD(P)-dependent dehydrogenase (short-subunit alcohol dehydrogenase family)